MILKKIIVHHFGPVASNPSASTLNLTESHIENAHTAAGFYLSAMGWHIGYQIIIYADGSFKQYRLIGEEGCHTIGSNLDSVGICLSGNFQQGIDQPTDAQKMALKRITQFLLDRTPERIGLKVARDTVLDFSIANVGPHRQFDTRRECYGNLPDNWVQTLLYDYTSQVTILRRTLDEAMKLLQTLLAQLQSKKLGRDDKGCDGHI
ncbi:MAG: N-acetylmuramoyl-L-alanine amidase [Candidatus Levybacteria bacterium]|nr:N-acetylmuramoyl-L-alanine amidase [Candidatus Levybacteria bacterium]